MDIIQTFAEFLTDLSLKATVLLVLACIAAWLLRCRSSAVRHRLWSLTMVSLIVLPVAATVLPSWTLPVLPAAKQLDVAVSDRDMEASADLVSRSDSIGSTANAPKSEQESDADLGFLTEGATDSGSVSNFVASNEPYGHTAAAEPKPQAPADLAGSAGSFGFWNLVLVWGFGAVLLAMIVATNVARTLRLCRLSKPIADGVWCRLIVELRQRLQLRRTVDLREYPNRVVPMTCGVWRPVVVLPQQANEWDEALQRTVLTHELAHVKRWDVLFQLVGRFACTLYWFHPLAWLALRKLRQEGEQACDDVVVQAGEKASDYAERLLRVAVLCCAPRGLSMGVAMAEGNNLEQRVNALFDSRRDHGPIRKAAAFSMLFVCGLLLSATAIIDPVSATQTEADPGETAVTGDTAVESVPAAATDEQPDFSATHAGTWRRGTEALERIVELKPIFGEERDGLKLGLALANPQRVFKVGDRLPVELFLFNVSDRVVTKLLHPEEAHPTVVDLQGRRLPVSRLTAHQVRPADVVTLNPGEACVVPAMGLGLGGKDPLSFSSIEVGQFRVSYSLAGLTSGSIGFNVTKGDAADLRIDVEYYRLRGISSSERISILKPVFGEARRGIEMGLAFSTLRRTYSVDEAVQHKGYSLLTPIPMDLFLRNVGEDEVSFEFHPDFNWSPPSVFNSRNEQIEIAPNHIWDDMPPISLTLKPGETYGFPTRGMHVTSSFAALSLVAPNVGTYRVQYSRMIAGEFARSDSSQEALTTGQLAFEVFDGDGRRQQVRLLTAHDGTANEQPHAAEASGTDEPAASEETAKDETQKDDTVIPLDKVIWGEKHGGLQAGVLVDSPDRLDQIVPQDSDVSYRILVRNTTDGRITFTARTVPFDDRDAPYLIPADRIKDSLAGPELPDRFRATDGRQGWKYDLAYETTLDPGESTIVTSHRGDDQISLHFGASGSEGMPRIQDVQPGKNWIVQPLQIWLSTEPEYGTGVLFEGLAFQTKADRDGKTVSQPATRTIASKGGTILHPRVRLDVGQPRSAADLRKQREAAKARVEELGGEVRPCDETTVGITLWKTKATDRDLEAIKCFNMVTLGLLGTQVIPIV